MALIIIIDHEMLVAGDGLAVDLTLSFENCSKVMRICELLFQVLTDFTSSS